MRRVIRHRRARAIRRAQYAAAAVACDQVRVDSLKTHVSLTQLLPREPFTARTAAATRPPRQVPHARRRSATGNVRPGRSRRARVRVRPQVAKVRSSSSRRRRTCRAGSSRPWFRRCWRTHGRSVPADRSAAAGRFVRLGLDREQGRAFALAAGVQCHLDVEIAQHGRSATSIVVTSSVDTAIRDALDRDAAGAGGAGDEVLHLGRRDRSRCRSRSRRGWGCPDTPRRV